MPDYSRLDQFLHRLALGSKFVAELSFDLEKQIFSSCPTRKDAVYVTGLARAGTTALMRGLYESNEFASLTYDDMPFVLAPNLWKKISRLDNKQRNLKERAHGDGIHVDFDSPEALEEVFWRIHCGEIYIHKETLRTHAVPQETVSLLRRYQSLVCCKYGKPRYLAKNNNQILRIANLSKSTPDTTFLILFREPIAQARSLLQQHQKFLTSDSFTRRYMTWLAHHEFGATHRPFQFFEHASVPGSSSSLQYWIDRWADAYAYLLGLLEEDRPNLIAVSYERLCGEKKYWEKLCTKLNVPIQPSPFRTIEPTNNTPEPSINIGHADAIYQALERISGQLISS